MQGPAPVAGLWPAIAAGVVALAGAALIPAFALGVFAATGWQGAVLASPQRGWPALAVALVAAVIVWWSCLSGPGDAVVRIFR